MHLLYMTGVLALSIFFSFSAIASDRSLSETPDANNLALVIGVSHGLPGIDIDVNNVEKMVKDPAYKFQSTRLMNSQGTVSNMLQKTKDLASKVDAHGTFFYYFSGHGNTGILSMQDKTVNIKQIRQAIEDGRKDKGPLERLVMMFDSCYSGSLLDLLRRSGIVTEFSVSSDSFADSILEEMTTQRGESYWKKLFVFASSRADETSNAGPNGSEFTVALAKAFKESMTANNTMKEFIKKTQAYTKGHHPVARLVPVDLENEKMNP